MGYKALLLKMKEARGFEKVGKRSVQLAAKQVKKDLGIQPKRSPQGAGIDMREALGRVFQRRSIARRRLRAQQEQDQQKFRTVARKIMAHQSSNGRSKGAGKGPAA